MDPTTCTIMVVEDEDLLLQAITTKMSKKDINTISCTRAEQAIDYLENLESLPDAIWLDYYLKGDTDGLDFLSIIKARDEWKDIPVVVVSNTACDEKVKKMLALGANKYMLKAEHRLEDILSAVQEFIK